MISTKFNKFKKDFIEKANNDNIKELVRNGNANSLNYIDTTNVTDMMRLFENYSFNGDISKWNVSNVINMDNMFSYSNFNQDISMWDVSKVKTMEYMFCGSNFKQNIDSWKINPKCNIRNMFLKSKREQLPTWYK